MEWAPDGYGLHIISSTGDVGELGKYLLTEETAPESCCSVNECLWSDLRRALFLDSSLNSEEILLLKDSIIVKMFFGNNLSSCVCVLIQLKHQGSPKVLIQFYSPEGGM